MEVALKLIIKVAPKLVKLRLLDISSLVKNKPAAQAAGADPSRCNSTNKPNPPFQ